MNQSASHLKTLRHALLQRRHRGLLILSGRSIWQQQQLQQLWTAGETLFWVGTNDTLNAYPDIHETPELITTVTAKQLPYALGQEVDSVVFHAADGINANSLGISSGMIRAGGLCVILTPDVHHWQTAINQDNQRFLSTPLTLEKALPHFTQHLIRQWQADSQTPAFWLQEQDNLSSEKSIEQVLSHYAETVSTDMEQPEDNQPSQDQKHAIEAIDSVAFGHRRRPLVVSADRGRGKSSALGMAAIECFIKGKTHIVVTASRLEQARMVFSHALLALDACSNQQQITIIENQPQRLEFTINDIKKTMEFIAPDQLVLTPTEADMLFVDEAAQLPTPLLTTLLSNHHRMVFATTLHGYEGAGRGFELRFKKTMSRLTPDWKQVHLEQPIRWNENDPLEQCINHALLLDSELTASSSSNDTYVESKHIDSMTLQIQPLTSESLTQQPALLQQVFGLLVQAHYQTSPNDLQQLLITPNLKLFVAQYQQKVVGVLLAIEEGKIMPQSQYSRLHGHLVPQLMVNNYMHADFLMLSCWRVMRIAVQPERQQQGIGKALLTRFTESAQQASIDYVCSSFGASDELLPFWFRQNFKPLHVGVKRDKASGSHNLVVAQALTPMAQQAIAAIQRAFQAQFPHTLIEHLTHFSASMLCLILQSFRFPPPPSTLDEAVYDYRDGHRNYEAISGLLWEWSLRNPSSIEKAESKMQAAWCDKVLKKQDWSTVAKTHHLPGRKGVEQLLQKMLQQIVEERPKTATKPTSQSVSKTNFGQY